MPDQSSIELFKERHNRLMSTENEKNKLIEVSATQSAVVLVLNDHFRTSCAASSLQRTNIKDPDLTMTGRSDTTGKVRCERLNYRISSAE